MYYSLTFIPFQDEVGSRTRPPFSLTTDRNTWDHWRIAPTSRPVFAPPAQKTEYSEIPGTNGKLDLSQVLTGYPLYSNRTGSFEFVVMNDFRHWQTAYTDIMTTIHNKKLFCVYEEDPQYFYIGRWSVQNWASGESHSKITLAYDLEPYKWRIYDSNDAWLWDPFNFSTGIITSRDEYGFNSSVEVDVENYPISDDPGAAYKILLHTHDIPFLGDRTTTDFGEGFPDALNNISEIVGNAPIVPQFTVRPREGQTDVLVRLIFNNIELPSYAQHREILIDHAITNEEIPDIILSNYTGVNGITLTIQGDGVVSWVYRPGRL